MDIGKNIKNARKNAGLTQEQLAGKCNLATITIRQYESGRREPKMEQLSTLAEALGIHVLSLLGYPAEEEYTVSGTVHFSVESMARLIEKKYHIERDIAKNIVEECYYAIKMEGQEISDTATMVNLFDSLDSEKKQGALEYLVKLMKENPPEGLSGGC